MLFYNTLSLLCLQALSGKQNKESGGGGGPGEGGGMVDRWGTKRSREEEGGEGTTRRCSTGMSQR